MTEAEKGRRKRGRKKWVRVLDFSVNPRKEERKKNGGEVKEEEEEVSVF